MVPKMKEKSKMSPIKEEKDQKERNVKTKSLKDRLREEDEFVKGLINMMYIPKHKLPNQLQEEVDDVMMSEDANMRKALLGNTDRAHTVDELQQRLQEKLKQLRGNRDPNKKQKAKLTKVERREKTKEKKKLQQKLLRAGKMQSVANAENKQKVKKVSAKPIYNNEGKMVFSKFDFTEDNDRAEKEKKQNLDPKSALNKIKKQKEKLESLKAIGKTERVKTLEEKAAWKTALDKSQGVKVKDDEALLKKSIKKLEQRKKSSKKKWETRETNVEQRKQMKQKKRSENIKKRKEQVKSNKTKKAVKKGRIVPGF